MKVTVNGKEHEVTATVVSELLSELGVQSPEQVAVELNGDILDREAYSHTGIKQDDQLEFVYFMGGGHGTH